MAKTKPATKQRSNTKTEGAILEQVLSGIDLGDAITWKNIQVFPLSRPNGHEAAYALLDDLLDAGVAEVAEMHEGGEVPTIKVLNRSEFDALVIDGIELHGAKQNRMVNLTIIAGKRSETEIPVACVEAGRWAYRSREFSSSGRTVASRLRARKAAMVSESLACFCEASVDQGRVWEEVDKYLCAADAASPSSALDAAFEGRADEVEDSLKKLEEIAAHGAVVVINGEIVSLDLFDTQETFKKVWPALVRGHSLDAVLERGDTPKTLSRQKVCSWLKRTRREAKANRYDVPGVGEYHSVRGKKVAGGIAVHDNEVVHVALFAVPENEAICGEV